MSKEVKQLKISPLKYYPEPGFPDHNVLKEHPELLVLMPSRWKARPVVLTALAGASLLLPGCSNKRYLPQGGRIMGKVATPSIMLSESEARQIIVDEAKHHGIIFKSTSRTTHIDVPVSKRDSVNLKLTLDGFDRNHNLGFEYVSQDDFSKWKKKNLKWGKLASHCDFSTAAKVIRIGLEKSGREKHYMVVSPPPTYTAVDAQRNLRQQVRDYLQWLKAEGVI
jgi:hypothetical protein